MAQVISIGTALLRICPTNNKKIEYSSNGKYWTTHYTGSTYGEFYDLLLFGSEIFAVTSKGLYVSKNSDQKLIYVLPLLSTSPTLSHIPVFLPPTRHHR